MDMLQELYDSEINWWIETFWDGGFCWGLGLRPSMVPTTMPSCLADCKEEGNTDTLGEAIAALVGAALRHYPDSAFAKAQRNAASALIADAITKEA